MENKNHEERFNLVFSLFGVFCVFCLVINIIDIVFTGGKIFEDSTFIITCGCFGIIAFYIFIFFD